jgi:hypothetical protein
MAVRGKYNPPILCDKPILEAFDTIDPQTTQQLSLFFLAHSNRVLWMSALRIRKELNTQHSLNTLHVRYLLLIFFSTLGKKDVSTVTIERGDYPKKDAQRLRTMLSLGTCGLCTITERSGENNKINRSIGLTDAGRAAIGIINTIVSEVTHKYPIQHYAYVPNHRIDKYYNIKRLIDTDYKVKRK